jgi:hypothetical protein
MDRKVSIMSTISGSLKFDRARDAVSSPALTGIANVPIVLQNTETGKMLSVYTDANGMYTFVNVPDGSYRIVEAYGIAAAASPGDFNNAQTANPVSSAFPPINQDHPFKGWFKKIGPIRALSLAMPKGIK